MFSTQAMVIIWGDGVVNYIIVVIISRYTSNHHAVHLKPAQWYMSYVSVQAERQSRSKPSFAENPPFFFSFQSCSDRKAATIHIFHKQKISLGILWKGHFLGSTLRASDSWCEWTQNVLIPSGGDPGFSVTRNTQHWARSLCAALF